MPNIDFLKSSKKKKTKIKQNKVEDNKIFVSDIDGIDIDSYSKAHGISIDEIKQKIKTQQLISRSERGEIYIYEEPLDPGSVDSNLEKIEEEFTIELKDVNVKLVDDFISDVHIDTSIQSENNSGFSENIELDESQKTLIDTKLEQAASTESSRVLDAHVQKESKENLGLKQELKQDDEKRLESRDEKISQTKEVQTSLGLPPVSSIEADSTMGYLAILAENLKISKQEQIELLKLTQESIKRVVDSTEKLIATKETLIEEKDKVIKSMQEKINEYTSTRSKLLQENEDLKILVQALELSNKRYQNVK